MIGKPRVLGAALRAVAHHAVLIAIVVIAVAPIVVMALTALMDNRQALTGDLIPDRLRWSTFGEVFETAPMVRYMANTMLVAVASTIGVVVSSVPVAYALSHLEWRGRQLSLVAVMFVYLLPAQATMVPLYVWFAELGWIGSYKPLIVPSFFGNAFSIFLLRQYFMTVPRQLADVARLDGAGELRVMLQVVVPLTKPAIAAAALLHFLFVWDDLYRPLLYVGGNRDRWTLSLAMSEFHGLHTVEWNQIMAASLVFMVPVFLIFLVAQRSILRGINLTGKAPGQ